MKERITVVCGFGRCGSTLAMTMLWAGGMPVYADTACGFESEVVDLLPLKTTWMQNAVGRAVKVLNPHINVLPQTYGYNFIWMDRNERDMALSMAKFSRTLIGVNMSHTDQIRLERNLKQDRATVLPLLRRYEESRLLMLNFADIVTRPEEAAETLANFCDCDLNPEKMASVVVRRSPKCYPGMMETRFLDRVLA